MLDRFSDLDIPSKRYILAILIEETKNASEVIAECPNRTLPQARLQTLLEQASVLGSPHLLFAVGLFPRLHPLFKILVEGTSCLIQLLIVFFLVDNDKLIDAFKHLEQIAL